MGDAKKSVADTASDYKEPKQSISLLRETKPSVNIALEKSSVGGSTSGTPVEVSSETNKSNIETEKHSSQTNIETVFKTTMENSNSTIVDSEIQGNDTNIAKTPSKNDASSPTTEKIESKDKTQIDSNLEIKNPKAISSDTTRSEKIVMKNHSDIFSLNAVEKNIASDLFSVKGTQSRKPFEKREISSNIFATESNKLVDNKTVKSIEDLKKIELIETHSRTSQARNPVTGIGVNSKDEFVTKTARKKDGNPVLGLGYDDESKSLGSASSNQRIPPGGYSKGLW